MTSSRRSAFARDLQEADTQADSEDLVLPHEAIVGNLADDIIGNLARLVERTAREQQAELIAAQPGHRVGIAHRVFDQRGQLAQQTVSGHVPTAVVHRLEAIQVQVAQHMMRGGGVSGFQALLQTALEFAPIDQAGQCIVARLIRHLPSQATQLSDIANQYRRPDEFAPQDLSAAMP